MSELLHLNLYTTMGPVSCSILQLLFDAKLYRDDNEQINQICFPGALGVAQTSNLRKKAMPDHLDDMFRMSWQNNPFNYRFTFGPRALTEEGIYDLAVISKTILSIEESYALTCVNEKREILISAGMHKHPEEVYQKELRSVRDHFIHLIEDPTIDPFRSVYEGVIPLGGNKPKTTQIVYC